MNVKRYRKKTFMVEASDPISEANVSEIKGWCNAVESPLTVGTCSMFLKIGDAFHIAIPGDRIVKLVDADGTNFFICKPDFFNHAYEELPE